MKSSRADIIRSVFERVSERNESIGKAVFVAEELSRWPEQAVETLIRNQLLIPGEPANSVVCHECEEGCRRRVEIIEQAGGRVAISTCHLFSGFGPFEHPLHRLDRWYSTRRMVAKFVATQLGRPLPKAEGNDVRFHFGILRFGGERRAVSLEFNDMSGVSTNETQSG